MPKIYQYSGINFWFWSNEHDPIHIHARYGRKLIVIKLYVKDGKVSRVAYKGTFGESKDKELKNFISVMKENIRVAWIDYFINHKHISTITINKKIK